MALIINHNMPAMTAARNLGTIYGKLGKSIERLSSGLRINTAADDAAGLAIREMMRADIATTLQGIRNAADAVSMIQTADGALAVVDARLIRMKELAEQAATGTYTTAQRELINAEFQAMADEIERIAMATNFNGIKLLDGSMSSRNGGEGIRIHFGVGNNRAEDYYYINTDDVRPRTSTGLGLGGDSTRDIWGNGGGDSGLDGCCGGAFASSAAAALTISGQAFIFGYNWDSNDALEANNGSALVAFENAGRYLAGIYGYKAAGISLSDLTAAVNAGTQSRAKVTFNDTLVATGGTGSTQYAAICLGSSEVFFIGSAAPAEAAIGTGKTYRKFDGTAGDLAEQINSASVSYRALVDGDNVLIFRIDQGNYDSSEIGYRSSVPTNDGNVTFTNLATKATSDVGTKLSYGGLHWANMELVPVAGGQVNVKLTGADAGDGYDIQIVTSENSDYTNYMAVTNRAFDFGGPLPTSMLEIENASDGTGTVRTQETAQKALESVDEAIRRKDGIRANLGSIQNRLEATIENLTIQAENLQASESRVSDVDVATEMTEFTKNNILAQAATAMLAQANSLSSLALTLLSGW